MTGPFPDYYQFAHPTRIVAGRGMIEGVGFEFMKDGAKRPLIVTDAGLRETGLVEKVEAGVTGGGLEVAAVFDEVPQDSSVATVEACAAAAKEAGADSFVAVGGGSVMDTAKVSAAVFSHGGEVLDYEGIYQLPREADGLGAPLPTAPIACIPTTAGTGSEVSFAAVIKDPEQSFKVLFGDFPLFPRLAILDPESTATLPPHIAAATGMDAMTHAIEGYTSSEGSPHGEAFALNALRLMRDNLAVAVEDPSNEDARGNMLVAACQAIVPGAGGTSALGAVHSMSHPAGAQYGVAERIHGRAHPGLQARQPRVRARAGPARPARRLLRRQGRRAREARIQGGRAREVHRAAREYSQIHWKAERARHERRRAHFARARSRDADFLLRGPRGEGLARGGLLRDGHGHLVDALHRHARLQPAHPHGLRHPDHARLDGDRGRGLGLRAGDGDAHHDGPRPPGVRRHPDGHRHLRHALHRHGGHGDFAADPVRVAAVRRFRRHRDRGGLRRALDPSR